MPGIKRCAYGQGQQMKRGPHKLTLPAQVLPMYHTAQVGGTAGRKACLNTDK